MTNNKSVEKLNYELNLDIGFDPRQKKVINNMGNTIKMPNNTIIGNLIIEFQIVKPKNYNIKGSTLDLFNMQKISLVQALCGLEMSIKLPNDKKITIYYDDIIHPAKYYKIKNGGIPYRKKETNELLYHDLYINFEIMFPNTLETKIKKSLCDLFGYTFNPKIDNSFILEPSTIESDEMENNHHEENFQGVQCAQQ
jgi:DnaJ-class molecular chaperone